MAGFFGIGDFTKEGPGVRKDTRKKRGVFMFLELFFRKFWKMCRLNVLYAIAALPTFIVTFILSGVVTQNLIGMTMQVDPGFAQDTGMLDMVLRFFVSLVVMIFWGMGPVTAGFTYVLRNYSREEHSWLWSDFWQHTKANFRQALVVWVIDLIAMILLLVAYVFYSYQTSALFYMRYVIICLAIIYTMMHFYIYQMMVTFKMTLKELYRNALIFSFAKLPLNLLVLAVLLLINVGIPYFGLMGIGERGMLLFEIIFLLLEFVIFISLSGFVVNFSAYQGIKAYMLPEEEEPETADSEVE